MERVTRHFQEELEALQERLLAMGGLAEERMIESVRSLASRDLETVQRLLVGDEPINGLHIEIDDRCFKLLALHQPMAADLRAIVAAVKINTDLERVGDLAVNIAEAAKRYLQHPPVKPLIDIPRMGDIAQGMLRDALDAFVRRDVALAEAVLAEDDRLDELKTQIFRELLTFMLSDPSTIEPSLDLILISRHLERIGDHATNIAEDVIFMVSARDVRHHPRRHPVKTARTVHAGTRARLSTLQLDRMDRRVLCVLCQTRAVEPRWRPFCSQRCQTLDQARWAEGAYRVETPSATPLNRPDADDEEDDG